MDVQDVVPDIRKWYAWWHGVAGCANCRIAQQHIVLTKA